jgi:hypothetical protein
MGNIIAIHTKVGTDPTTCSCRICFEPLGEFMGEDDHGGVYIRCQKCGIWNYISNQVMSVGGDENA